ncbi:Fic family protein [Oligoflexus tunisiensis]|uniref:Fic family protein n=1 Tax=Oligoflexus tunisiensis TaxID=708132 RepID=UPI000B15CFBB|nr:Fic/DOC family N-terminal domain-containing protein [Oligoflexus tunisiensis]
MYNANYPFQLPLLPPNITITEHPRLMEFLHRHNDAQKYVSELNGALKEIDNPDVFLSSFFLQEAISSNAVENIHTTIESVLEDETKPNRERSRQNKEVLKYRNALSAGESYLRQYGMSSRTIRAVHQALEVEKGVPGEFRTVQNRIANSLQDGSTETIYTPPLYSQVESLLGNWESFVERNTDFFPLVKVAICHYQFEAIHPFEDGNGRTGRILMILQLISDQMLSHPALFISGYLSQNQTEYKKRLLRVTSHGEWWEFIEFMLIGFSTQALVTKLAIAQLKTARKHIRELLYNNKIENIKLNQSYIGPVVDHLFSSPLTTAQHMADKTKIHWQTCSKYLTAFTNAGVLTMHKIGKYKIYRNEVAVDALKVNPK